MSTEFQTIEGHRFTTLQRTYASQAKKDRKKAALERIAFNKEYQNKEID